MFSECGRYRQSLDWDWTAPGAVPRTILFVGMNPSVADARAADPTCFRELTFARDWGYSRYLKANMLDYRATVPKDLPRDPARARSAANLPAIRTMAAEAETVLLAYGRLHPRYGDMVSETLGLLRASGRPLLCFGRNKDGSAKHPLYLRRDSRPQPF